MIYSIVVWGFDTDNDYQRDCDLINVKSLRKRLIMLLTIYQNCHLLAILQLYQ